MEKSKIGRILAIVTSILVTLLGIAFIISCAHLYFTGGDTPYSAERVGEYLSWLVIPSVITILAVLGGIIYNVVTGETDVENAKRTSSEMLELYKQRYELSAFGESTEKEVLTIREKQKIFNIISICVSALLMLIGLVYLVFVADFSVENLNADVIAALSVVMPLMAIALAIHIPRAYLAENSAAKELDLLKSAIKNSGVPKANPQVKRDKKDEKTANIVRCVILGVSAILIVLGIVNGGMADVLAKAVKICTECIGLG